jgi:hypothetical protein
LRLRQQACHPGDRDGHPRPEGLSSRHGASRAGAALRARLLPPDLDPSPLATIGRLVAAREAVPAASGQAVTSLLVKRAHAIAQKITAYTPNDSSPCSRSEVAIGVRSRESKNSHQWVGR